MNKYIKHYLLTAGLYDFIFAYAIYNAYFKLQGLPIHQISILLAFWAFSAMVLEIPSGAMADHWSHKKMIVLAPLIKMMTFIIWGLAQGQILLYGLGFFLWALGSTMRSGTMEAYLYELLQANQQTVQYEIILGKVKFYKQIAIGLAMISGGVLASFQIELPIFLSVVPLLMSAFFALQLPECSNHQDAELSYWHHIENARRALFNNRTLQVLLLYGLVISLMGDLEEFDQLYLQFLKMPLWSFGFIAFLISFGSSLTMRFSFYLKGKRHIYWLLPLLASISLFSISYVHQYLSVVLLLLAYLVIAPLYVLIEGRIQNSIEDASRATVTSLHGLLINFMGVVITPLLGYVSDRFSILIIYSIIGSAMLTLSLFSISSKKIRG